MRYWTPSHDVSVWLRSHYMVDDMGVLAFRVTRKLVKVTTMQSGHQVISVCNMELGLRRQVYVHRLVYFLHHGVLPENRLDHVDLDKTNNRIENLRLVTCRQNNSNVPKRKQYAGRTPTSKFKGVGWHKQAEKWVAQIHVNKRNIHLGLFDVETEAAAAYDAATLKYNGEFGRGNT